jgi:hypothetical protein
MVSSIISLVFLPKMQNLFPSTRTPQGSSSSWRLYNITDQYSSKGQGQLGTGSYACNLSYSGGRNQEDRGLKPA